MKILHGVIICLDLFLLLLIFLWVSKAAIESYEIKGESK